MTTTDVARLYDLLEAARCESRQAHRELKEEVVAAHRELRDEVQGYRADLNGRLKALELHEAHRDDKGTGRAGVGRLVLGTAAVAASIGSVVGTVVVLL